MNKLTKEELLKIVDDLEYETSVWGPDYGLIEKCINSIKKFINEYFDPQPYTFEKLHKGMWVWDDRTKECKIVLKTYITDDEDDVFVPDVKIVRFGYKYQWNDAFFEANRFFPITKAYQEKE